jgi:exodeoxyribonuclease VII small subunit
MSDAAQSQAIMFEPTHEPELRVARGRGSSDEAGQEESGPKGVRDAEVGSVGAGRSGSTRDREQITFEQGYEELKSIVTRLDDPELPVDEMFEGFRRGKGLEKALRAYLQEREGELVELEEGNNLPEFEIASPSSGPAAA